MASPWGSSTAINSDIDPFGCRDAHSQTQKGQSLPDGAVMRQPSMDHHGPFLEQIGRSNMVQHCRWLIYIYILLLILININYIPQHRSRAGTKGSTSRVVFFQRRCRKDQIKTTRQYFILGKTAKNGESLVFTPNLSMLVRAHHILPVNFQGLLAGAASPAAQAMRHRRWRISSMEEPWENWWRPMMFVVQKLFQTWSNMFKRLNIRWSRPSVWISDYMCIIQQA